MDPMNRPRTGQVWLLALACLAPGLTAAQPNRTDPAPVDREVVQRLVHQRLGKPDALPQVLQRRLDESGALLREIARPKSDQDAGSRRARVAALAQQVESLRTEARQRLAASRERLQAQGLSDQLTKWDALSARVEQRFDTMRRSLDAVSAAASPALARQAAAAALAELDAVARAGSQRDRPDMPVMRPNWRSQKAQPASELRRAPRPPSYLSYEASDRLYAFSGNTMLALAPPALPGSAANCGSPAELAASLAETQDVRITPEIRALAERLGYSPARILRHVYDTIAYEPYYGSLKGSVGTLVAGSGGATDQTSLLIALLRASNIPARYVKAQVRVTDPAPDPTGGRVARWLGAKSYAGAAAMLGQGQNPSVITINNANAEAVGVSFTHVWAEACVPYSHYRGMQHSNAGARWIPLDASFKDVSYEAGIATNVNFDYAGFLARRSHLLPDEYFAEQVRQAIQAGNTSASLADVGDKRRVNPLIIDVLPASTPFDVSSFLSWDGGSSPEVAELPDSHRIKLNLAVSNGAGAPLLSQTLSLPETSLNRLTLSFRGATPSDQSAFNAWQSDGSMGTALPCTVNVVPVLRGGSHGTEGVELAAGSASNPLGVCSTDNQLTMSVTLAELVNPTLNSVSYDNIHAANYHALQAYAFQASDRLLGERASALLASVRSVASPHQALDETEGEFLHLVGLKYMRYISDASRRIGRIDGGSGDVGNHLGLTASQMKVLYLFDVPYAVARTGFLIDVPGGRSRNVDLASGELVWKTFLLSGYSSSAFEYYVWQENVRMDAVSTTRGMQFASEAGIPLLTASASNWNTLAAGIGTNPGCSLSTSNLNYPQCWIDSIKANYIDQGFTVTLPQSLIHYGTWRGSVYVTALDNTASTTGEESVAGFIINGYSGGYTVQNEPSALTTYDAGPDTGYATPNPAVPQPTNAAGLNNGFDPRHTVLDGDLNVATGGVFRSERDFSAAGRGGMPFVLDRSYNSRNPKPGPFGHGWTHSFNHFLSFKDDNGNGVTDAGDSDGLSSTVGWTDGTGGEKLFQVAGTAGGVAIGSTFTRTPGTFAVMTRQADGRYAVREKDGTTYLFESLAGTSGQTARLVAVQDRNSNTLTLNRNAGCGNQLCSVSDALGRSLTFSYQGDLVTRVTDWTGRQFGYTYTDGNLTSFANPLALAGRQAPVQYEYFGSADGPNLARLLKTVRLPRGNGYRYEYYATGKLFRRFDALGQSRTYTYNDFRRETVQINERGHTRSYLLDRYGNTVQLTEEDGATHAYTYDVSVPANVHNRISHRNPLGQTTAFTYDGSGNVTLVREPSGHTVEYASFNAFGQPGRVKDPNGNYAVFKYDARGNRTQEIRLSQGFCASGVCATLDPATYVPVASHIVSWRVRGHDSHGNLTSVKTVRDFAAQVATPSATSATSGPVTNIAYDANGLFPVGVSRSGRKNADSSVSTQTATVQHDALGRTRVSIDSDWHRRDMSYDDLDRVIAATDARGLLRSFSYDDNSNPVGQRLDVNGQLVDSSSMGFDLADRPVRSVDAGGNVTAYVYDETGNVVMVVNPDNLATTHEYDPLGRHVSSIDPEGAAHQRSLDALGRPRTMSDPNGSITSFVYHGAEASGRLQSVTDPTGKRIQFAYDANGNAVSVTVLATDGSATRTTATRFDELDRPTRVVGPLVADATLGTIRPVTRYTYDTLGHLIEVAAGHTTDLSGNSTASDVLTVQLSRTYDDFGRKTREADGLNRAWVFTHDEHNNVVTSTDPRNQTTRFAWSYGHQLMEVQDHAGSQYAYTRNPLGQVTRASSPAVTYDVTYDESHRVASVRDSRAGKTLSYRYSPGGLLNSRTDSDGNRIDHDYDTVGRLAGIWAPNQDYVSLAYDRGGRLTHKWLVGANGALVQSRYTYEPGDRLQSLTHLAGNLTVSTHSYGYDVFGNRNASTDTMAGVTRNQTYTHDALNRLVEVGNGNAAELQRFAYDPLGNRISHQVGSAAPTVYRHDAANQLTELRSGSLTGPLLATLGYDDNGNLLTRSDTGLVLAYDPLNRMTSASRAGQTSSFVYDDQGRRIQKTHAGTTTMFVYDGPDIAAEYAAGWGAPQAQYVQGAGIDNPLIRIAGTTAQYLHQDALGSVAAATNSASTVVMTQRFDAWGNLVASSGTPSRYGYTGREPDETGLVFYRARYYDPTTGRFTQRDPIGLAGGLNPYSYTDNRPTTLTDPTGNCPMCIGAITSVVIGGVIRYVGSGGDWNATFDAGAIATDAALGAAGTGLINKGMQIYQEARLAGMTGIERSRYLGRIGEDSVGIADRGKTAINVEGRTRYPDQLTPNGITEVKNVAQISARDAKQILDDVIHAAGREGFDVTVLTREVTDLSRIQHLIDKGLITHDVLRKISEQGLRILSDAEAAGIGGALGSLRNLLEAIRGSGGYTVGELPAIP